LIKLSNKS